jgi:glutamate-1-semialdehyde 2,1-aminomutase
MIKQFNASTSLLERTLRVMPLGANCFSKSHLTFPRGISPLYARSATGCRLTDVDGNEFIDFDMSLTSKILGYGDPDVQQAVREVDDASYSLPSSLPTEVAEMIKDMVPCAEMVRFGKNGSDVTTAAVRLARAYTGRTMVAQCGYHGWQDWSNGVSGRNLGVPNETKNLTKTFKYNDVESLERVLEANPGQFALVIMEPMNRVLPAYCFLDKCRDAAHRHGALFCLDEVITGFRYGLQGAAGLFDVKPDLTTFGKCVANGYPLSVLAGRADVMSLLPKIHWSTTFADENTSMAAAKATLKKLKDQNVPVRIYATGQYLVDGVDSLISKYDLFATITGHPTWSFLEFGTHKQKVLWQQEIYQRGIFTLGQHAISYAHTKEDVDELLRVYDEVFEILAEATGDEDAYLRTKVEEPTMKIR